MIGIEIYCQLKISNLELFSLLHKAGYSKKVKYQTILLDVISTRSTLFLIANILY